MTDSPIMLDMLPLAARLARRGRPTVHVAAEAKVSASTWDRLEQGKAISLPSLFRIVHFLGIPLLIEPGIAGVHEWNQPNGESVVMEEEPAELVQEEGDSDG